jgi:hypothetical protein
MRMSELANDVSISVSGLTRVVERLSFARNWEQGAGPRDRHPPTVHHRRVL